MELPVFQQRDVRRVPEQVEVREQQQEHPSKQKTVSRPTLWAANDFGELPENACDSQRENRNEHEGDEQCL
jgi:hypothetical protein